MQQYEFHSTWNVSAGRERVRMALLDYERYPMWWKQVRLVETTPAGIRTTCRSLLPYDLTFTVVQYSLDDGSLVGQLHGDLEGTAQWQLHDTPGGTRMEYRQEVTLQKTSLRRVSPLLRPAFRFNHTLMMRDGRNGLERYLKAD